MKFRNTTVDALRSLGQVVEPGDDLIATADEAPGLVLQCRADGNWEPSDPEAQKAVQVADAAEADAEQASAEVATPIVDVVPEQLPAGDASASPEPEPDVSAESATNKE